MLMLLKKKKKKVVKKIHHTYASFSLALWELMHFTSRGNCCQNRVAEKIHYLLWNIHGELSCQNCTPPYLPGPGGEGWQLPSQQFSSLHWYNWAVSERVDFTHIFVPRAIKCLQSQCTFVFLYTAILRFIMFLWNTNALQRFKTGWLLHINQTTLVTLWGWTDFSLKDLGTLLKAEWDDQ